MTVYLNTVKVEDKNIKNDINFLNEWIKKKKAVITRIVILKDSIRIYTT